jgi:hypothetical protein
MVIIPWSNSFKVCGNYAETRAETRDRDAGQETRDRERRDKPAHCRGWKSPTEKEKRLYSGLESCLRSREG